MAAITAGQTKKIYATARELGIDNDLLHAMIETRYNLEHIKEMTTKQAGLFIDLMEKQIVRPNRSVNLPTGRSAALASEKQLWKINELAKELGWDENPRRLRGFCKKYSGSDDVRFLTGQQAWRLIEGLKKLVQKKKKEQIT